MRNLVAAYLRVPDVTCADGAAAPVFVGGVGYRVARNGEPVAHVLVNGRGVGNVCLEALFAEPARHYGRSADVGEGASRYV